MDIIEFRNIKKQLLEIVTMVENLSSLDLSANEYNAKYDEYLRMFFSLQEKLLSSDLSHIPYKEWEGMVLYSEGILDLSRTKANIDFTLLKDVSYDEINLKGCNIINIGDIRVNNAFFDEEYIALHPEIFHSDILVPEIKDKYYDGQLDLHDIIKYPDLIKCCTIENFSKIYNSSSYILMQTIGYEETISITKEYPELIKYVIDNIDWYRIGKFNEQNTKTYENSKHYIFDLIIYSVKNGYKMSFPPREIIPVEMMEYNPSAFLDTGVSDELSNLFYNGDLHLGIIRFYIDIFSGKDLSIGIKNSSNLGKIEKIYGNLMDYIKDVPEELDKMVLYMLTYYENVEHLNKNNLIAESIRYYLRSNNDVLDFDTLYICLKYLSLDELVYVDAVKDFVLNCGLEVLKEFNEQYNGILNHTYSKHTDSYDEVVYGLFAMFAKKVELTSPITSTQDLKEYLNKIFYEIRKDNSWDVTRVLNTFKPALSFVFRNHYINYNALEPLLVNTPEPSFAIFIERIEKAFNGDTKLLLHLLNSTPQLKEAFKGREVIFASNNAQYYYELRSILGEDKFLDICILYGESLDFLLSQCNEKVLFNKLIDSMNVEETINEELYKFITADRKFDIRILPDSFKTSYPELYLKDGAPYDFVSSFYGYNRYGNYILLSAEDLQEHPEWIPHLKHIDLKKCLRKSDMRVYASAPNVKMSYLHLMSVYEALESIFTKDEVLDMIRNYGEVFDSLYNINLNLSMPKEKCYSVLLDYIYKQIISRSISLKKNLSEEIGKQYPDIKLSDNAPEDLKVVFYNRLLTAGLIKDNPHWITYLKSKNISAVCHKAILLFVEEAKTYLLSNEEILKLFAKYGDYLVKGRVRLTDYIPSTNIHPHIIKEIIDSIIHDGTLYDEDLRELLDGKYSELFLDDDAPEELKNHFYNRKAHAPLTFDLLKKHREWLPYLQDKDVLTSLKKINVGLEGFDYLFSRYDRQTALKIGMKNPESVMKMLTSNKASLLCDWYDKLGFIPHYVVMMDYPLEQSDKFLSSARLWSQITRIERHNFDEDSKTAILKASMCFGVFEGDKEGFNKLMHLFNDIPRMLTLNDMNSLLTRLSRERAAVIELEGEVERVEEEINLLKESYFKTSDDHYVLNFNPQTQPNKTNVLRGMMERMGLPLVISPLQAHKLFGGFNMTYSPDFRDFLLKNLETILSSDDYITYASSMQKQWKQIKAFNSNRTLTLDLALSFVKSQSYSDVHVGNERLAELANSTGYSEQTFDTLQRIYNIGKQRVFSSIPRVYGTTSEYTYEILRLDDPLALAIGTLSDCCQELGNAAEVCMEHSAVNKHGRVFVIKNKEGEIVAQSWVWRNNNVICFDNIEVPDKQMYSHGFMRGQEESALRNEFTDALLNIYIDAAKKMIEMENIHLQRLLAEGKITKEQFDNLRITKITTGEGHSNIKGSLLTLDTDDSLTSPIRFLPPIELTRGLYTSDSDSIQYILAGDDLSRQPSSDTLPIFSDEYIIVDDSTITKEQLITLQNLEYACHDERYYGITQIYKDENVVTQIANNCDLNPDVTKIIMNANFAIIFEENDNEIVLGEILFNDKVKNDKEEENIKHIVTIQIRLALDQISSNGKTINSSRLNNESLDIFNEAINLNEEIDKERGLI